MSAVEEPRRTPWIRVAALSLFLLSAALPVYRCTGPEQRSRPTASNVVVVRAAPAEERIPYEEIARRLRSGWASGGAVGSVWLARDWYPYLLAPLWLAAMLAAPRLDARGRWRLGAAFLTLSGAIAVFEAFYIANDFDGVTGGALQTGERIVAWLMVAAILVYRPRGLRVSAVEATVSSQALLCFFHALTFPAYDAFHWAVAEHEIPAIVTAVVGRYRPAFWLAVGALALAAIPAYLRRTATVREPRVAPAGLPTSPALDAEG